VHDVKVRDTSVAMAIDAEALTAGAALAVEVTGATTLTTVPIAGSYRIYGLTGGNVATGVLTDVLTLYPSNGTFVMEITFDAAAANFLPTHVGFFEFGIDVFQEKSGTNEAMCIEVESVEYAAYEELKPSPPFVIYCVDQGDGHFTPSVPAPPAGSRIHPHAIASPSCNTSTPCDLDWFYCPRDPGCATYTMSVSDVIVDVRDKTTYKTGDAVTLTVNGTTTLTSCPVAGSYRIYSLAGKNQQAGVLCDVLTILPGGAFILSIPITLVDDDFTQPPDSWFDFGLDVFQQGSGSDEAMCIQVSNPAYADAMKAKPAPPVRCLAPRSLLRVRPHLPSPSFTSSKNCALYLTSVRNGLHRHGRRPLQEVRADVPRDRSPRNVPP
jgi:hypothetical protein